MSFRRFLFLNLLVTIATIWGLVKIEFGVAASQKDVRGNRATSQSLESEPAQATDHWTRFEIKSERRSEFLQAGIKPGRSLQTQLMGKARAIGVASAESGSSPLRSVHQSLLSQTRDVGTSRPQSMKPQFSRSDAGSIPAASTIRGGVLVSTVKSGAGETAEEHPRKSEQTNKRQLRVAEGGLKPLPEAGSPGHQNQPSLLDEIKNDMIYAASHLCGVSSSLVRRVMMRESSGRWQVHPLSHATGYMQIVPRWIRGGPERQRRVTTEAFSNIVEGACRLRRYIDRFGLPAALHAYHGGPTRVMEGRVLGVSVAYAADILEER